MLLKWQMRFVTIAPHRANGDVAYHVLDVMHSILESSESRQHIQVQSSCERPEAMPIEGIKA